MLTLQKKIKFADYHNHLYSSLSDDQFQIFRQLKNNHERIIFIANMKNRIRVPINVSKMSGKNLNEAKKLKDLGNDYFMKENYIKALENYNQAIFKSSSLMPEFQSELPLFYANRSAALYHLKRYTLSMRDIDYSLEIGYPKHLKYKILDRKSRCYLAMEQHQMACDFFKKTIIALDDAQLPIAKRQKWQTDIQIMLSMISKNRKRVGKHSAEVMKKSATIKGLRNSKYEALSSAIEIKYSDNLGRHGIAKSNIKVGEIIVIEEAHCAVLLQEYKETNCHNCFKSIELPEPCPSCDIVKFCSHECKDHAIATFHRLECSINFFLINMDISVSCLMALRIITQRKIDDFLKMTDEIYDVRNNSSLKLNSSMYESVHNLVTHEEKRNNDDLLHRAHMAVFLLECLKYTGYFKEVTTNVLDEFETFSSEEIYIGKLLLHHLQILQFNAHEVSEVQIQDNNMETCQSEFIGGALYPSLALLNHSCNPNLIRYFEGTRVVAITIQNIKAGEMICENYGPLFTETNLKKRQETLKRQYWFECTCDACTNNWPVLSEMNQLQDVKFRCTNKKCQNPTNIDINATDFIIKCCKCLKDLNMFKPLKALQESDSKFKYAKDLLRANKMKNALQEYINLLNLLDEHLVPPYKDYYICLQALRTCFLFNGNVSCIRKKKYIHTINTKITEDMSDKLWKECTKWLTRCQALRIDHRLNWPDANMQDLAFTLRDGVLLCNLLHILDPDLLDMKDVNQKPQMARFLCMRNIKLFLQKCHDVYDLPQSDLFDPTMLFDLVDFYSVLRTLSKLSCSIKLRQRGIIGFSVTDDEPGSDYHFLERTSDNKSDNADVYTSDDCHADSERIYHEIMTNQLPDKTTFTNKRDHVINELLSTEKNYVEVLDAIQNKFMIPLANCITPQDLNLIFKGIKKIASIHTEFHSKLKTACSPYSKIRLSEVFLEFKQKFIVYGEYCANLTSAKDQISIISKDGVINQEIKKCEQEANNGKFTICDILAVPMQRILKYHLLVSSLLQETKTQNDDYQGLQHAKEAMLDVASYINDVKRDFDALNNVDSIQKNISDWHVKENSDLRSYGKLKIDGEIKIKRSTDAKIKQRYAFLLDRALLICKQLRGDNHSFKELIPFNEYKIEEPNRRIFHRDHSIRWNHIFHLVNKNEPSHIFTFNFRTEENKTKWINAIKEVMDNMNPIAVQQSQHILEFHSFDNPPSCGQCNKFLKGLILQGYKCKNCGIALHKDCIGESERCSIKHAPDIPPRPTASLNSIHQTRGETSTDWKQTWPELIYYLWFVGSMDRDEATDLLLNHIDGTYLVRIRIQAPTNIKESIFALSLKTDGQVKHMKIYENKENGQSTFYLSQSKYFPSLIELVKCYEQTSLAENFKGLNVRLRWPIKRISATAEFDFYPKEANQLPMQKGDHLTILSKEGDEKGWWKGQIGERIGFFPKMYIKETIVQ